tara:strand:- start:86 stop:274 length:189 start_codon:yes stop_codon:yes gene_type:complete
MNQFFDKTPPTGNFPICNKCIHQLKDLSCMAFDKIPNEILLGENDHSKPLPEQDNNIVFEEI